MISRLRTWILSPSKWLSAPGAFGHFLRYQIALWKHCSRRQKETNASAMAAALSFRTIFALIPVLVLGFFFLQSLGILQETADHLQRYVFRVTGISQIVIVMDPEEPWEEPRVVQVIDPPPEEPDENDNGETVEQEPAIEVMPPLSPTAPPPPQERVVTVSEKILEIVERVEEQFTFDRIGPVGILLLIYTALTLLTTMERSLNRIFEAPRHRAFWMRTLLYWSVVSLGPLMLLTAFYGGEALARRVAFLPVLAWVIAILSWLMGVVAGILFLASIYKFMPNTHVRFRGALGGAFVVAPLWLLARWGFGWYVQNFVAVGNIYGTLGLIPLFLMWVYLSWVLFLFGAQIAYTSVNVYRMQAAEEMGEVFIGPSALLAGLFAVAKGYLDGRGPVHYDRIATLVRLPERHLRRILEHLERLGLICPADLHDPDADSSAYVLAKPPERIPLLDLLDLMGPRSQSLQLHEMAPELADALTRVRLRATAELGDVTLKDFLAPGR